MPNSNELGELIELLQRSTERTAETLDARMHEWRTQQANDYQRVLDGLYRLERKVEQGQKDMQIAQAAYQDEDQIERTARQEENDRRFRRIEVWLALVTLPVLIMLARVIWVW